MYQFGILGLSKVFIWFFCMLLSLPAEEGGGDGDDDDDCAQISLEIDGKKNPK